MKNKVIMALVLTVTLLVGVMIGGCRSNIVEAETQRIDFGQIGRYGYFCEYRDTETGVHYLTTQEGGVCPRYAANGELYVD
jgi:hypothetical protein